MPNKIIALSPIQNVIEKYLLNPYPVLLKPSIQHYEWGQMGKEAFIPTLLGQNPGTKPWAELWLGIHSAGPAQLTIDNHPIPLNKIYPSIPWLFKVLGAKEMLSVQVHPNQTQAKMGYIKETEQKIPSDKRSYKDPNPKPEMAIPITDFWAMSGFLPQNELLSTMQRFPEIASFFKAEVDIIQKAGTSSELKLAYQTLYERMMQLSQTDLNRIWFPILRRIQKLHLTKPFTKSEREYWLIEADKKYTQTGLFDVGMFSILLFNLIHLSPNQNSEKVWIDQPGDAIHLPQGTGIYLSAGIPHFYLEGVCFEHMQNSDNVVRAGLTPKFKDVPELLKIIDYSPGAYQPIPPKIETDPQFEEKIYQNESPLFALAIVNLIENGEKCETIKNDKPLCILVMEGNIQIEWETGTKLVQKGQSIIIPARDQSQYKITTPTGAQYIKAFQP